MWGPTENQQASRLNTRSQLLFPHYMSRLRFRKNKVPRRLRRDSIAAPWFEARRASLTGSIFLAVCLLLSSAIDETCPFSPFLNRLFSESFLIVGWVAMWRPIELSLCEWWPFRHELRVYERIGKMPLSIMAAPDPTSSVILAL
jgi:hypothetical protein